MQPHFIPGLELSRRFYADCVRPIMQQYAPNLDYAAALIGSGSDILGNDTQQSTDHDWGPRVMIFMRDTDSLAQFHDLNSHFQNELPITFLDFPTLYKPSDAPNEEHVMILADESDNHARLRHRIDGFILHDFFANEFQVNDLDDISLIDWLILPEQSLLELTAGAVYHDEIGMEDLRQQFAYLPDDVWYFKMGCAWEHIAQEEHLMPRADMVGDHIGARLIASRLVHVLMHLCFMMERRYAPYPKWFGTDFQKLDCAPRLSPIFERILTATSAESRLSAMNEAYIKVAEMHNALNITDAITTEVSAFHTRPFDVIHGERFMAALFALIEDDNIKRLANEMPIGAVDQFSENTLLRSKASLRRNLRRLFTQ